MRDAKLWSERSPIAYIIWAGFLVWLLSAPAIVKAASANMIQAKTGSQISALSTPGSASVQQKSKEGWYFPVVPPSGDGTIFYVGPYHTIAGCQDMYGSAIYYHPFACHLTGPHPPSNCRILGNGFAYPRDYPYPVPSNDVIVGVADGGGCVKRTIAADDPKQGWYFLFYTHNSSTLVKCKDYKADSKLSAYNPSEQVGYYHNKSCPGAPCFSVGFDTACN